MLQHHILICNLNKRITINRTNARITKKQCYTNDNATHVLNVKRNCSYNYRLILSTIKTATAHSETTEILPRALTYLESSCCFDVSKYQR